MACTCTCTCDGDHTTAWSSWTSTATTSSTATNVVWATWTASSDSTTTSTVWGTWAASSTGGVHVIRAQPYVAPKLTAKQIEAQRIAQAEAAKKVEEKRAAQAAAHRRAMELLLAHLTEKQRETYEKSKWFVVEGGKSGKRYRIRDTGSPAGNIDELADNDNEKVVYRLCAHAPYSFEVPMGDQLLAQKLMLEWAEEDMLKIANRRAA